MDCEQAGQAVPMINHWYRCTGKIISCLATFSPQCFYPTQYGVFYRHEKTGTKVKEQKRKKRADKSRVT